MVYCSSCLVVLPSGLDRMNDILFLEYLLPVPMGAANMLGYKLSNKVGYAIRTANLFLLLPLSTANMARTGITATRKKEDTTRDMNAMVIISE